MHRSCTHGYGFPITWLLVAFFLGACAAPDQRFDRRANALGLIREEIRGEGFRHAVFRRLDDPEVGRLHVYLGSDGTPWLQGRWPAEDPTPRSPLALELMALDPAPAVYIGRPCYHGLASDSRCGMPLWTERRYSEEIVASLTAAVRRLALERPLVLIGYSGGGALAMLMASRLPTVAAVVTVAANLDVDAWVEHHGYRSLVGSLNPADQPALDPAVVQLHFAGAEDENVPPALIRAVLARLAAPSLRVLADHSHNRGWRESWPVILSALQAQLGAAFGSPAHQAK